MMVSHGWAVLLIVLMLQDVFIVVSHNAFCTGLL